MIRAIMLPSNSSSWLRVRLPLACILSLSAGCTSVESTMVTRDETNQIWERHNCLNGIPITLKVPTHLKLYVFHKHYLEAVRKKGETKVSGVRPVNIDVVVRDFAHEFMYTEKVFVVDFKRPAAGSSKLRVNMTKEQYIDEIQHDITDETISAVTGVLGAFTGPRGLSVKAEPVSGDLKPDVTELRSLVAVGIFEIEDPDFEWKVKQFMDCHVNKSHDAWVVPPKVGSINRVGIPPGDNVQVPYPPVPLCPRIEEHPAVLTPEMSSALPGPYAAHYNALE
jgi:hypothetical protein